MGKERLDKVLAHLGLGSRTEMKAWIRAGRVAVDGAAVTDPGLHVNPAEQVLAVDGAAVEYRRHCYVLLHKPAGVITAATDPTRPTVMDVVPDELLGRGLFPVGRLDRDTEGLLLLTTDGELGHRLLSPKWHVPKRYYVRTARALQLGDPAAFAAGITLQDDGYRCQPAILLPQGTHEAAVTIREGKYHQIRRMFGALGNEVVYLRRLSMGPQDLGDLAVGRARALTAAEVRALYAATGLAQP